MKVSKASSFLAGYFIGLVVWWLSIFFSGKTDDPSNLWFALAYGILPIFGSVFGFIYAEKWGFWKSTIGKAIILFSLGLLTWGIGELIWSYYNLILHVEIPYPSWADASFIISWPLWAIGMYYLSFATGAKYGLKEKIGQFQLFLFPVICASVSYYLLVTIARQGSFEIAGGPLKIFFDLAYPLGDVIIITLSLIIFGLSFKYLGGRYKWAVLVTFLGFVLNYFADFGFSYTTTVGTFHNGNWVDLLFCTAMFALSFGINNLDGKE